MRQAQTNLFDACRRCAFGIRLNGAMTSRRPASDGRRCAGPGSEMRRRGRSQLRMRSQRDEIVHCRQRQRRRNRPASRSQPIESRHTSDNRNRRDPCPRDRPSRVHPTQIAWTTGPGRSRRPPGRAHDRTSARAAAPARSALDAHRRAYLIETSASTGVIGVQEKGPHDRRECPSNEAEWSGRVVAVNVKDGSSTTSSSPLSEPDLISAFGPQCPPRRILHLRGQ